MDIAERCELDLRRRLRSAERFSEAAILRGLDFVNTRFSSVSASLSRVTRADQRLPLRLALFDLVRWVWPLLPLTCANWAVFRALHGLNLGLRFDPN